MMKELHLSIVSPEKSVFDGEVKIVTLPGTVGSFSILPGHAPIVSSLKAGTLGYTTMDGEEHTLDIQGGFVEVYAAFLMLQDKSGSGGFFLLVDDPLDRNSQTADDPVEGASQHREQAFAVGHGGQALDASGIQHLAVAEATLNSEALGLVCVSNLAQDAGSSSRVLSRQSNCGITLEVLSNSFVLGASNSTAQHGVFDNHVLNASFTQFLTHLGIISNADAVVSNDNASQRTSDLGVQLCNISLLGFQNLCTGHLFSPHSACKIYRQAALSKEKATFPLPGKWL